MSTAMTFIGLLGGSGHSVLSNTVGGTAAGASGANMVTSQAFRGIDLVVGAAPASSVQGNTVKNIRSTLAGSFLADAGKSPAR